eukprot:snap_masked-scaffold864_size87066-processed-gene-0.0 protein:Tk10865 transcript:snap_masked-scaffold864_size87066-processed-gene-0.0-mRNA-1 annotation:"hypothetical protein CAPTEDRAFT_220004"
MELQIHGLPPQAQLAITSLTAARHPSESCGHNGLPLTPNSITILGRAQGLRSLAHPHLCTFLDCLRGQHERVIFVWEHFRESLCDRIQAQPEASIEACLQIAGQSLQGLAYLHARGVIHAALEPDLIRFEADQVRLGGYALGHTTHYGACVAFPIFNPRFTAPEVLALGRPVVELEPLSPMGEGVDESVPSESAPNPPYDPKCDVWSWGMCLACLALGLPTLWPDLSWPQLIRKVLSFQAYQGPIFERVARENQAQTRYDRVPEVLKRIIDGCLQVSVAQRMSVDELMSSLSLTPIPNHTSPSFPTLELRCGPLSTPRLDSDNPSEEPCPMALLSIQETYYLWKLAGGDVLGELGQHGLLVTRPPILALPQVVTHEGHVVGQKRERSSLYDPQVIPLNLVQLRECLSQVPLEDLYPLLLENEGVDWELGQMEGSDPTASLPIVIKESDVRYQFKRIIQYRRLLQGYPHLRPLLWREAKLDSLPLYRGYIWAALLDIDYDTAAFYEKFDKETWTPTDRQIEVDIPRCHQYDNLLASPEGHRKFKRVLKAWVSANPQYVYWQGLDSLCAPFLYLNFNDEALAFACLSAFIPKYLYGMFQKDNAPVIQEYLAKLTHMQAFHDPELFNHLDGIGFIPDLYAIPWILTMFAHVFPLNNIFHLWDKLLLGNSAFPLCIGLAILYQLRERLLQAEFNDCILLFSDIPAIDIEKCVNDSIRIFCTTPNSITYRKYGSPPKDAAQSDSFSSSFEIIPDPLDIASITLVQQKAEKLPRLSGSDLLQLIEPKVKVLVIDCRPVEEYRLGTLPESVHLPPNQAFEASGGLTPTAEAKLKARKSKVACVVGSQQHEAETVDFAQRLLEQGIHRLCVLHNGIEIFRSKNGILRVPNA